MDNYYNEHAIDFINDTFSCDMSELYLFFEKYILNSQTLLDVGFGSGRDMLYFKNKGLDVYGIDPSIEMCNNAKKLGLNNIFNVGALNMNLNMQFDSIWACASLLHIKMDDLGTAFDNCAKHLKENGIMYCSFKYGEFEGERNGRFFTDMNEKMLKYLIEHSNLIVEETKITEDVRPDKTTKWLNVILRKII